MITKKNYVILLTMIATLTLAYLGLLGMFRFTACWGMWRMIAFYFLSVILFYIPSALLLYLYNRTTEKK